MKKQPKLLAALEVKYWKRRYGYTHLSGHGVIYGYVEGDWVYVGDYLHDQQRQHKYSISAKRVLSVRYASNLLELKKALKLYGKQFNQDEFIKFLKSNQIAFRTHPVTTKGKRDIIRLSKERHLQLEEKRAKQIKANQHNHSAMHLRKLARDGEYKKFLKIFFETHPRLNRQSTRCSEVRGAVYHGRLFRMPNQVKKNIRRRGILA